jgi:hypothetical protein
MYINPIELLELQNYTAQEIDSSLIKKTKRKLFADIDLSDDGLFDYKGVSLTKTDCEATIEDLKNPDYAEFYLYLAISNQPLNDFLVNGDESLFSKLSQESIYKLPEFINFISPYFAPRFDKALFSAFKDKNYATTQNILRTQNLINIADKNTAFKSISIAIADNIREIEDITSKIKNKETKWTSNTISGLLRWVNIWVPVNILNILPQYFQSQINKTAAALNQLQLAIWDNIYNSSVCQQILDILLSLNIESVSKQIFEKNYDIVKKADEKKHFDKLISLLDSFESKSKTIVNARELIYQAKPYLFNIKAISHGNDNTYISLSTRVAFVAQDFVIEEVNKEQSSDNSIQRILGYATLKSVLKNAWEVIQLIGSLDLQDDFRTNRYNPNKETLQDICSKLSVATPQLVLGKMPQCNFVILDSEITHTNNGNLPITNPFIRGDIRYIGLNLKVEALGNQTVKFSLKYIQPNGTIKTGTSSPAGFSFAEDKIINVNTKLISLSGWGNAEKNTYVVGTHHIEVWIDGCMIYIKSFVVDFSPEEKRENAKRETERREQERIEAEKRKEQARIAEQKEKEKKVRTVCLWIMGIFIALAVIFAIWGTEGLEVVGGIVGFIAFFGFIGWIQNATKR